MFDKERFVKFIKAVELVAPQGRVAMGLVVNKSGAAVKWTEFLTNPVIVAVEGLSDSPVELIEKLGRAVSDKRRIVLEIKDRLPGELFAQLRSLAISNRMQMANGEEVKDVKLSEARIIVSGLSEVIDRVKKEYPDFIGLFGPVIEV
jgi:hypothetical protein